MSDLPTGATLKLVDARSGEEMLVVLNAKPATFYFCLCWCLRSAASFAFSAVGAFISDECKVERIAGTAKPKATVEQAKRIAVNAEHKAQKEACRAKIATAQKARAARCTQTLDSMRAQAQTAAAAKRAEQLAHAEEKGVWTYDDNHKTFELDGEKFHTLDKIKEKYSKQAAVMARNAKLF